MAPRGKKFIERKMNNSDGKLSLPRINGASSLPSSNLPTFRSRTSSRAAAPSEKGEDSATTPAAAFMGVTSYDPKKPLTVELQVCVMSCLNLSRGCFP